MNTTDRDIFLLRLEAKWQFQRTLLLAAAALLEQDSSGRLWEKTQIDLAERLANPDEIIRKTARAWKRRSPQKKVLIQVIRDKFEQETPEGTRRHKLQEIFEGYPFAAIVPEPQRSELYRRAYQPLQAPQPQQQPAI